MKVIIEIVDYLLDKGVLEAEDREYLIKKDIYPKLNYEDFDYHFEYYDPPLDGINEELINESRIDEEILKLEQKLENKRPVVKKPNRRFKKKKLAPKHAKEKIVKETLSSIENISWRPPVTINTHERHLEVLINKFFFHERVIGSRKGVFTDVGLFWDWAYQKMESEPYQDKYWDYKKLQGETFSLDHNDFTKVFIIFSEEAISRMGRQKEKRTDDYIRPAAFFELLKIPEIVREGWSLKLQLRDGHQIRITDIEGRFVFER